METRHTVGVPTLNLTSVPPSTIPMKTTSAVLLPQDEAAAIGGDIRKTLLLTVFAMIGEILLLFGVLQGR